MRLLLALFPACGGLSAHAVYVSNDPVSDSAAPEGDADTDADSDSDADGDTDPDPSGNGLIISEVCDYADDDNARFIELWNAGTDRSLLGLAVRRYSNGSSTFAEAAMPDLPVAADGRFVIAYNQTGFVGAFGVDASAYSGVVSGNGNDVYELVVIDPPSVVDVYGVVAVDGTGEAWEYTDADAQRNGGITSGAATFDVGQWTITPGTAAATPGS